MRRRSRLRRWLKWGELVMSLLIIGAWAFSCMFALGYRKAFSQANSSGYSREVQFELAHGCIDLLLDIPGTGDFHFFDRYPKRIVAWTPYFLSSKWLPYFGQGNSYLVRLPLWIPFLLFAMPTAFLFWRNHRYIPPGHCQRCRYDQTGNVSGVCPECGRVVEASTKT